MQEEEKIIRDLSGLLKYYTKEEIDSILAPILKKTENIESLEKQLGKYIIWVGTKAEYEAIKAKEPNTLYFIRGE